MKNRFSWLLLLAGVLATDMTYAMQRGGATTRRRSSSAADKTGKRVPAATAAAKQPKGQKPGLMPNLAPWSMKKRVLVCGALIVAGAAAGDYGYATLVGTEALTPQLLALLTSWYPTQEAALQYLQENCPEAVTSFALNNMSLQMIKCYAHQLVIGLGTFSAGAAAYAAWMRDGVCDFVSSYWPFGAGSKNLPFDCVTDNATNVTVCTQTPE